MIKNNFDTPCDMPKLESPFIRKEINGLYIVTPEINPEYSWVFEESATKAIEKLDGTNVSIVINNRKIVKIFNRTQEIDVFRNPLIGEALLHSAQKGYLPNEDGQYFGEAIGDKIQTNFIKVKERLWIPFLKAESSLMYKSWFAHPRTFENISVWFRDYLFSLANQKYGTNDKSIFAEGIVFYHPDGIRMAKLRRDMFDWYQGERHKENNI